MRPIDADALLTVPNVNWVYQYDETGEYIKYKAIPVEAIEQAPTLDLAPVAHGRWIPGEEKCPVCKKDKFDGLDADIWADWQPAYCPNCGAKMDGGKTDDT